jgi:zinc protease
MQKNIIKIWRSLVLSIVILLLIIGSRNVAFADIPRNYQEIKYPPLPELELPDFDRYQLTNGMVVYLVEDHRLPLISGYALMRTGSRFEPNDQVGLAEITGDLMRTGGTKHHSPDELNDILEAKAASIETEIDTSSGTASFSLLSYDLDRIFPLFAEVIREPAFAPEKLALAKTQLQGAIARRNDNPSNIANREFAKLIYGENSPYARTIENKTLDNIARQDIIEFYHQYIRPEEMILGVVGDFDPIKMKALIAQNLGDWQNNNPQPSWKLTSPQQVTNSGIYLVNQPQLTQSNIALGHIGGQLNDRNYSTLSLINGVLNGFGGRLYNDIRSRQGLAYSVYGFWSAGYDYPGMFIAGGQTKSETTAQFIKSTLSEIERLQQELITEKELDYAKDSILNSFVFKFQNPSQTLSRLLTYEYYNYPQDFIFKYQKAVKNTTREDILEVAQKELKPDNIVTLVVGNEQVVKPDLATLNQPINNIKLKGESTVN